MSLKDDLIKTIENVKDAAGEALHRGAADAEQTKRDVAGDQMTIGEKAGSMFEQAKHTVAADVDETKRKLRD